MDKITHQVRAEHWNKIMNECIKSGMSKSAWCNIRAYNIQLKERAGADDTKVLAAPLTDEMKLLLEFVNTN